MRDQRKGIQSVEHGAKLLEALINSRKALPLKTLAAAAGMSASMAHRYLTSFIRADLVEQDRLSGHYDLGTLALRQQNFELAELMLGHPPPPPG